ncbi:MAG: CDP-diacylglycerol--serine O-phosphatidyltransferase [Bacteroidaceae bacterium]|jgi:CDP-diacylglycerol--serine O-phosphatidyltransferase|nr:CDP-diacylglycerol--serine O-phosphatidyltransferase [Bacteroidaceae bacterium]
MSLIKNNIPNAVTCCNLICGCIAAGAAFNYNLQTALLFIILGAVFDFFDGMTARALHVSSPIGKELDSLADCVTFGVAPSAMLFTVMTQVQYPSFIPVSWRAFLPFTAFIMAAFSALRLAKFNLDTRQTTSFIGLPTPANALFWGALIVGAKDFLVSQHFNILLLIFLMLIFSYTLVAEIPMFSLKVKNLSWEDNKVRYTFLAVSIVLIAWLKIPGIAAAIAWYIVLSVLLNYVTVTPPTYGNKDNYNK